MARSANSFGPYALCGWRVVSDLPLPELREWDAQVLERRALRFELGGASAAAETSFTAGADGRALLRVQTVGAFHLNASGDRIVIEPEEGVDPLLLRAYLYSSVLALLCYQHGFLPLHGASVLVQGCAVIFSGPSGAGKSTLATAMARRGHAVLSDDVCAIDLGNPARPQLWPAFPRVKLLPDAIRAFRLGLPRHTPARHWGRKAISAWRPWTRRSHRRSPYRLRPFTS